MTSSSRQWIKLKDLSQLKIDHPLLGSCTYNTGSVAGPGSKFTGRCYLRNVENTSACTTDFTLSYEYCPAAGPTDSTNAVAESSETNNEYYAVLGGTANLPDLSISATSVPYTGSTAYAGATFTVQSSVLNASLVAVNGAFSIYYACAEVFIPRVEDHDLTDLAEATRRVELAPELRARVEPYIRTTWPGLLP